MEDLVRQAFATALSEKELAQYGRLMLMTAFKASRKVQDAMESILAEDLAAGQREMQPAAHPRTVAAPKSVKVPDVASLRQPLPTPQNPKDRVFTGTQGAAILGITAGAFLMRGKMQSLGKKTKRGAQSIKLYSQAEIDKIGKVQGKRWPKPQAPRIEKPVTDPTSRQFDKNEAGRRAKLGASNFYQRARALGLGVKDTAHPSSRTLYSQDEIDQVIQGKRTAGRPKATGAAPMVAMPAVVQMVNGVAQ